MLGRLKKLIHIKSIRKHLQVHMCTITLPSPGASPSGCWSARQLGPPWVAGDLPCLGTLGSPTRLTGASNLPLWTTSYHSACAHSLSQHLWPSSPGLPSLPAPLRFRLRVLLPFGRSVQGIRKSCQVEAKSPLRGDEWCGDGWCADGADRQFINVTGEQKLLIYASCGKTPICC